MTFRDAPFNEMFKLREPYERLPIGAIAYKTGSHKDIFLVVVHGARLGLIVVMRDFEIEMLDRRARFCMPLGI